MLAQDSPAPAAGTEEAVSVVAAISTPLTLSPKEAIFAPADSPISLSPLCPLTSLASPTSPTSPTAASNVRPARHSIATEASDASISTRDQSCSSASHITPLSIFPSSSSPSPQKDGQAEIAYNKDTSARDSTDHDLGQDWIHETQDKDTDPAQIRAHLSSTMDESLTTRPDAQAVPRVPAVPAVSNVPAVDAPLSAPKLESPEAPRPRNRTAAVGLHKADDVESDAEPDDHDKNGPYAHGWPGMDATKKRRRIGQIERWAAEILDIGQERTYCACSVGCALPRSLDTVTRTRDAAFHAASGTAAAAAASHAAVSAASAAAARESLRRETEADTNNSADSAASASPSTPSLSSLSSPVWPSVTSQASTRLSSRCDACLHPIMPRRPFVCVGDSRMLKSSRLPRDSAGKNIRYALWKIRKLVTRKKEAIAAKMERDKQKGHNQEKQDRDSPEQHNHRMQKRRREREREQEEWNRRLARMRPWDQWHEMNCQHTSGEFFMQTKMYCTDDEVTPMMAIAIAATTVRKAVAARKAATSLANMNPMKKSVPAAPEQTSMGGFDGCNDLADGHLDALDDEDLSSFDSDNANSLELRRHRQRQGAARLRRAQRLLMATNMADVA